MAMPSEPTVFHVQYADSHGLHLVVRELPNVGLHGLRDVLAWTFRRKPRCRLIVVDTFAKWGMLAWLASVLWRTPLVVWLNAEYFTEQREVLEASTGWLKWPRYLWRVTSGRLVLRRAIRVLPDSEHIRKSMAPWIGPKGGGIVYPPFRPPAATTTPGTSPALPAGRLRLLTVMHLQFTSKIALTQEAITQWLPASVWEELDIQWVICGSGLQAERFRREIAAAGHADRVHFPGHLDQMAAAYEWCDVLVHLTRLEAFGRVIMEAHMAGKPVITNVDSCGVREQVFDGETGRIIEDADTFVAALRAYAADPEPGRQQGQRGRRQVQERFLLEHQQQRMAAALREISHPNRPS